MRRGHLPLAQHEAAAMPLSPSQPRRKDRRGLLAERPQPNWLEGAEQSILGLDCAGLAQSGRAGAAVRRRTAQGNVLPSAA